MRGEDEAGLFCGLDPAEKRREGLKKAKYSIKQLKNIIMTGGGGGGTYIPPARRREALSCEMLVVETVLTKPIEEQLITLTVGQVLTVHVQGHCVYVMFGDQIVGYIEAPVLFI